MFTTINYEQVLDSPDICDMIKSCALLMQKNTYYSLAKFLQSFRSHELQEFVELIGDPNDPVLKQPVLLTCILLQAEGIAAEDPTEFAIYVDFAIFIITVESLRRKGLVTVDYSQITFNNAFNPDHYKNGIEVVREDD